MDLELTGRVCLVTGGSSGIGLASAQALVGEGARVLLVGRDADRLVSAKHGCQDGTGTVDVLSLDVTSPDAGTSLLDEAQRRFGGVDALINSAGTSRARDLEALAEADWQEQWELNVMAPKRLMDSLAPAIAAAKGGTIVNVCSSAGRRPSTTNGAYSVTKRAELALTQIYAERYGALGVRINAVAPGPTETPLWLDRGGLLEQLAEDRGQTGAEVLASVAAGLPTGRLASAAEIASVIVLLVAGMHSPNGAIWAVDGGHVPDVMS